MKNLSSRSLWLGYLKECCAIKHLYKSKSYLLELEQAKSSVSMLVSQLSLKVVIDGVIEQHLLHNSPVAELFCRRIKLVSLLN